MSNRRHVTWYHAIWISDVHLGTRGCKAEQLLDFLSRTESKFLYLVGDIIDGWRLKKSWYCPASHTEVIQRLLAKARSGTEVIYVPGNHDEVMRDYVGLVLGGVTIARDAVHETADGKRLWVTHGDQFDAVAACAKWLAHLGDVGYTVALTVNVWFNAVRRSLGYPYWSLSKYLKHKVKNAVAKVGRFEETLAEEARRRGVDGVVCGHIHHAEMRTFGGITYCNDGDWVESCTALVEHRDGRLEILDWLKQAVPALPKAVANAA